LALKVCKVHQVKLPTHYNFCSCIWSYHRNMDSKIGAMVSAVLNTSYVSNDIFYKFYDCCKRVFIGHQGTGWHPGFGFWQPAVALIFCIVAKEVVVGTLGTLYSANDTGLRNAITQSFSPLSAYYFMVMSLIYIPCIAAIATIKRETNWKWTTLAVGYSLLLGWVIANLIFQVGRIFV